MSQRIVIDDCVWTKCIAEVLENGTCIINQRRDEGLYESVSLSRDEMVSLIVGYVKVMGGLTTALLVALAGTSQNEEE